MKRVFLLILLIYFSSCTEDEGPLESTSLEPKFQELYSLEDEIPYDILGSGKILFKRGLSMEYNRTYVIDIDKRESWGFYIHNLRHPCLANNGEKIAFSHSPTYTYTPKYNIYTIDIYGNEVTQLTDINGFANYPAWNSSDDLIIFWGGGIFSNPDRIFAIGTDGSNLTEIKSFNNNSGIQSYSPSGRMSISEDNKIIYVVHNGSTSGLCKIDIDGNNFEVLVNAPERENFESPRFSPDNQSIAYLSIKHDINFEYESMSIRILNVATNGSEEIYTTNIGFREWDSAIYESTWLCWSPDGTKLLFTKPEADVTSHIYLLNKDGSQLTQVTSLEGVWDHRISWSK